MNVNDLTPRSLGRLISRFIRRYHLIIFFVFASVIFGASVIHIQSMLSTVALDDTYTSKINAGSIDIGTLQRINSLQSSSDVTTLPLPPTGTRTNPFGE